MAKGNTSSKKGIKDLFIQNGSMDITFLFFVVVLLLIGLMMLFSASYAYAETNYGNSYKFITQQALFAAVGFVLMLLISKIDYHYYMRISWLVYIVAVALLLLVYVMPATEGYHRWIYIGSFGFQPSEIAKFAIVLLFSHLISINYTAVRTFKFSILFLGGLLAIVCALVVFETHLSATILIFLIGAILLVCGGLKWQWIAGGAGLGVGAVGLMVVSGVAEYWGDRFQYWRDPWADATGKGYQTIQSLLSIGSGGVFGRGIGQSMQKYLWVPEPHNDFIFAIVCEELGLIGALVIIGLFCALLWRGFMIAMRAADKFGALLTIGLVCQVGLQALLNILVVTNTIPNTGISLPFFSYGGTAIVILLCEMGVVLSVSRYSSVNKG